MKIAERLRSVWRDEHGVTAVEYAVVAGAIVAAFALAFTALGGSLNTFLTGLSF